MFWEVLIGSFIFFLILGILGLFLFRLWALNQAHKEAQLLIQDANSELEMVELDIKEQLAELEQEIYSPHEQAIKRAEEKVQELEEKVQNYQASFNDLRLKYREELDKIEERLNEQERNYQLMVHDVDSIKQNKQKMIDQFRAQLLSRLNLAHIEEILQPLVHKEIEFWQAYYQKWLKTQEILFQDQSEWRAKSLLSRVLIRFHRPYCPERGIPYVTFEEDEVPLMEEKLLHHPDLPLKVISEIVGCDLVFSKERNMIIVGGFDPVRREFARRLLERCCREKNPLTKDRIKNLAMNIRKELLQTIKRDGDLLAKELGLKHLHVEIRKMMGSLRYRYSFTQNQYFHCAEVGWLAGLMASELKNVNLFQARRAGMLHDLGKALDHEFEGGHAVIGAQFIEKYGESAEIVHAVRAHHYDETPSTVLAFLVIAADAISGGRPGARRSTVESYTQKVIDIENIAYSFPSVKSCIVLNGGRECRVQVDSQKTNDREALILAKEIASKIEQECSYPGSIKVVVMRHTLVHETKSLSKSNQK